MSIILAIESSCDDTGAAVLVNGKILTNYIASQSIHKKYGGVVPELASRAHQQNIVPVVETAIKDAGIGKRELQAIAYTAGPGLMGSLLVGASFAKAMALALNIPLIEVNHLHAHILSHFIDEPKPSFPFLCLLVSGGHTQIIRVDDFLKYEIIGETLDDAAGEAFDKAAKILDLPYPGGPLIDKYAREGNIHAFPFPTPSIPGYDFSYSGLKTSFLYFIRDNLHKDPEFVKKNLPDICASYQHRVIMHLLGKLKQAAFDSGISNIGIAGGVAANSYLREKITELGEKHNWNVFIPKMEYCTDNAAMIAIAGHYKFLAGELGGQEGSPFARNG